MSVILATQESEIRRIVVQSQPGQIVSETLSQKSPSQKKADGVAQSVGPEFKPQYCKKKKKEGMWGVKRDKSVRETFCSVLFNTVLFFNYINVLLILKISD
jgi:hypothetical protein